MADLVDPALVRHLDEVGQSHLVAHARTLEERRREAFLAAVAAQPWAELRAALGAEHVGIPPVLRPPQALTLSRQESEGGLPGSLAARGRQLVAGGRVATLLLAGGQGTRLGFDGPKGTFPLGPDPDRTLYAIQAERVAAAGREAGRPIVLILLVSEATEAATREAFAEGAGRWGLRPEQIHVVAQRQLPAFDDEGRAVLAAEGSLAMAPDGHGGALRALRAAGILDELVDAGVDVLTTYQVDNPLALPLDPVMLGWMLERRAQAVGKAVRRLPDEKVGVFARDLEGRHFVVEYSEFPEGGMPEDLVMGSIALHAFSVRWLKDLFDGGFSMPYHRARKSVPCLGPDGIAVTPKAPNATKLEQFIFDVFPHAERATVHEVDRAREFAPVKNASGPDSPETARALVAAEVKRWYEARGHAAPADGALRPLAMLESEA